MSENNQIIENILKNVEHEIFVMTNNHDKSVRKIRELLKDITLFNVTEEIDLTKKEPS